MQGSAQAILTGKDTTEQPTLRDRKGEEGGRSEQEGEREADTLAMYCKRIY